MNTEENENLQKQLGSIERLANDLDLFLHSRGWRPVFKLSDKDLNNIHKVADQIEDLTKEIRDIVMGELEHRDKKK